MKKPTTSKRKPAAQKRAVAIKHKTVVTSCQRCGTTFSFLDDGPFQPNICPDCAKQYGRNTTADN